MKKIYLIALTILTTGCAKNNETIDQVPREVTITASFIENKTKTILPDSGTSIYWEQGDDIKVFYGTTGSKFTSTLSESAAVSNFTGTLPIIFGSTEGISEDKKLLALYPYSSDATSDGESITATLPDEQDARKGSFAKKLNLSIAESNSFSMGFYNVCSGICFTLDTDNIKEISIKSNKGEALAGKVKIAFKNDVPAVLDITEAKDSITLFPPTGSTFSTGVWYYIVTLPVTLPEGFQMKFKTDAKYATVISSDSRKLKRGVFGRISNIDANLTWTNSRKTVGDAIVFEDITAKQACVAKFDSNKDGEISLGEASAVTDLTGLFDDYKTITSFDELRYFNHVSELPISLFGGCQALKSIVIPSSVEAIGPYCFSGCLELNNIDIPDSVKSIGDGCFSGCSKITRMVIPSSITKLGNSIFNGCSTLNKVTLPETLQSLGNYCFNMCIALQDIDLPANLSSIGEYCFSGCQYLSELVIPSSVTSLQAYFIKDCKSLTSLTIPASVKILEDYSFADSYIKELTVPNTVTYVGKYFLYRNPNIHKIAFDASVHAIPSSSGRGSCFYGCENLVSIRITSPVTSLPDYCFEGCTSLSEVTFPDNVSYFGEDCFYGCKNLVEIPIPSGLTIIGSNCFSACSSLKKVHFPEGLNTIKTRNSKYGVDYGCFSDCSSLESVYIPYSATNLDGLGFYNCKSLTTVNLPATLQKLGDFFFGNCESLDSIVIPSSVTELGSFCFNGCKNLKKLSIPNSVTSLGHSCFNDCQSLEEINIPSTITVLPYYLFESCKSLKSITIPQSVTEIEYGCFADCESLESIAIPNSVTIMGGGIFYGCSALKSVKLPDSITTLDNKVDYHSIGSSITKMNMGFFQRCSALKEIEIPDTVTNLGENCFYGCYNLSKLRCLSTVVPSAASNAFTYTKAATDGYLYVPEESVELYANDTNWKVWKHIQKLE